MARIFISYAREDQPFVRKLHDALLARQHETWIDWKDIPPTAAWMAEIEAGIEGADAFVFVLSPDSVTSEVCGRELAHALRHNKRLIPILHRELGDTHAPPELAALNWIFCRNEDHFDDSLQLLLQATETDLAWVHTHTRVLTRAIAWTDNNRNSGFLLRGRELATAEQWLLAVGDKEPRPTALHTEYIIASRRDATRRQRIVLGSVTGGFIVATVLAVVAFGLYRLSEQRNRVNIARRLAIEANATAADLPVQRLLLATEAVLATRRAGEPPVPAAETALRQALANTGGIGLGHTGAVRDIELSADGHWLLTGSADGVTRRWDLRAADPAADPTLLSAQPVALRHVALSPDGRWAANAGDGPSALLWDMRAANPAEEMLVLGEHDGPIQALALSPDGRWLATGGEDGATHLWRLQERPILSMTLPTTGTIIATALFSPDSRWLLTDGCHGLYCLWDMQRADLAGAPTILTPPDEASAGDSLPAGTAFLGDGEAQALFSPDSRWLVTAEPGAAPLVWDLNAADPAARPLVLHRSQSPFSLIVSQAISPDSRWLAAAGDDKRLYLYDLRADDPLASALLVPSADARLTTLAFSPDGLWLAAGGGATVYLWSVQNPAGTPWGLGGHDSPVGTLRFSPNGRWLAAVAGRSVYLWALDEVGLGAGAYMLTGHDGVITAVAITADSNWLVTASEDRTVRLWNLAQPQPAAMPLAFHRAWGTTAGIYFDTAGRRLITTNSGVVNLWDLSGADPGANVTLLGGPEAGILALAVSQDEQWLAIGGDDGAVFVWNLEELSAAPLNLQRHTQPVWDLVFSPDGHWLATAAMDAMPLLWDLTAPNPATGPQPLAGHSDRVMAVAFSPDGRWLATGSDDTTIRVWVITASAPVTATYVLHGHKDAIHDLVFTPDGRWLASAGGTDPLFLWPAHDLAAAPQTLSSQNYYIRDLAVSRDGRWLAAWGPYSEALLYNVASDDPDATTVHLRGHQQNISTAAFDASSQRLATASADGLIYLWDLTARHPEEEPVQFRVSASSLPMVNPPLVTALHAVAFSPDGRWLAAGDEGGGIHLWALSLDQSVDLACRTAGRNLSEEEWQQYFPGEPYHKICPNQP